MRKLVSVVMGSQSDLATMEVVEAIFQEFAIEYEMKIVSAHRTPEYMIEYAKTAKNNNIAVIIAGAGGAAHLPGMIASMTTIPVIGVPVQSRALNGLDSLLSIVQMPAGVPVATMAIGQAGAKNAALLAARILALEDEELNRRLSAKADATARDVLEDSVIKSV
ncbi:5-(carboxyamino)imidazole ribonucleotide mutase [Culicoidibacter larvae]|uniref:N5-carboxyaminoimidazole ribonucleotide mutase n=1 Tax=Culicoidibacter larvae TaxID=2579976 RepID=A0A5R8QCT2_9FIRM|nr:5-(carboxyamino)imidazole ribonucleotide mutase [Culicoidibacter larvae]TLG74335.1 5-(carboxyamino)imidazole ribonucleotide mutase [Culicoidibacter larvae]